jgi:hypothetical protein
LDSPCEGGEEEEEIGQGDYHIFKKKPTIYENDQGHYGLFLLSIGIWSVDVIDGGRKRNLL